MDNCLPHTATSHQPSQACGTRSCRTLIGSGKNKQKIAEVRIGITVLNRKRTSDQDWVSMCSNPSPGEDSGWHQNKVDPKHMPQHICVRSSILILIELRGWQWTWGNFLGFSSFTNSKPYSPQERWVHIYRQPGAGSQGTCQTSLRC